MDDFRTLLRESPTLIQIIAALSGLDPRTVRRFADGHVTARVDRIIRSTIAQLKLVQVAPGAVGALADLARAAAETTNPSTEGQAA